MRENIILFIMRAFVCILLATFIALVTSSSLLAQFPEGGDGDINWLIEVLELEEGSIVADIGAGEGDQTLEIARHVGSEGRVYSTELESELSELRRTLEEANINNVTVIEGDPQKTNLPENCCDALFLRRVYHHFDEPSSINASLWQSLKPGGRLAIIDFEPRSSEVDPEGRDVGGHHGVTAQTVVKELKQAGFTLINSSQPAGRNIYVVMEKPEENEQ